MDQLRRDLIVSLRRLRSSPGFTFSAILTLALGIGANTAIFTAVNALIFRPIPAVERPKELVALNSRLLKTEFPVTSYPDYLDFRDRNNVLAGLAGYHLADASFSQGDSNNTRAWTYEVTGNYFDLLGVTPLRGRLLHHDDDVSRGGHPVAVITASFWQRRFAGDPGIVGRKIKLNGMDYTIVGVTPPGFVGTEVIFTPDLFVPLAMVPQIEPSQGSSWLDSRDDRSLFVVGRLKAGVTRVQAEAALNSIATELGREYPNQDEGVKILLSEPGLFGNYLRATVQGFAVVLMGLAGMVLVIACVNLASLLLARAADRRKETAVRLALGASRGRLIRQLLTESTVLSIFGGALGVLLARWMVELFAAWQPPVDVPVVPVLHIDSQVLVFAALASLITGIVFGLAPAIQATRAELAPALKNEAVDDRLRRFQLRDLLVGAQVALSVVLIVGSVLVVRSLRHALSLNLGFEPRHAASVSYDLSLQGYDATRAREFQQRVLERVRSLPGIEAAGLINGLPLTLNINNSGILLEGKPPANTADTPLAAMFRISPGYLRAAGTKLVAGRDFNDGDKNGAPLVAIVNETFARQLLPGENPLGKRFHHEQNGPWQEIVGVVEDGKYRSLGEKPMPAVFQPLAQHGPGGTMLIARSPLPEEQTAALLRRTVAGFDSSISIFNVGSLTDRLGLVLLPAKIAASVLGAFGLLAIVLAATGVYGIMAYAVARRTREIGIRMALGAKPGQVLSVVLSHTAILVAIGTGAGVVLSLAAGKLFSQVLYGISATDPVTYAVAIGMMALVALAACWFPARRAIHVDPVRALRTE